MRNFGSNVRLSLRSSKLKILSGILLMVQLIWGIMTGDWNYNYNDSISCPYLFIELQTRAKGVGFRFLGCC